MQDFDERRHELMNLLSIALANVEALIDGIAPPTAARLEAIAEALRCAAELLQRERDSARKP